MLPLILAAPALLLPTAPPTGDRARVVFVVPPTKASPFGATCVLSREHWTTVDAADDLSWAVFHYSGSGCASVVGQSYLGALLCSADGRWPEGTKGGAELERIRAAFHTCGIEFFELYGHGPPAEGRSFMWTDAHAAWQEHNPPPLETIGDQSQCSSGVQLRRQCQGGCISISYLRHECSFSQNASP